MSWLYNNSDTSKLFNDGYAQGNRIRTGANLSETIFKTQFNWNDSTFIKWQFGQYTTETAIADGDTIRIGSISRNIMPALFTVSVRTNDATHTFRNITVGLAPPANATEYNDNTGALDDYATAPDWLKSYFGTILVENDDDSVLAATADMTTNQALMKGNTDFDVLIANRAANGRMSRTIGAVIDDVEKQGDLPSWWRKSNYYDIVVTMGDASAGGSGAITRKTLAFDGEFIQLNTF